MQYQTIKHLKTKSKLISISDTFNAALREIPIPAKFIELSYMGGFPIYTDGKYTYSIQGRSNIGIVCSLPEADVIGYKK